MKIKDLRKKYGLTENELCEEFIKYRRIYSTLFFDDLIEYEKGNYYICAAPYISCCTGDIAWNVNIYLWDGTYSEIKPNLPKDTLCKVSLKTKNRQHIQHLTITNSEKPKLKDVLENYLSIRGLV